MRGDPAGDRLAFGQGQPEALGAKLAAIDPNNLVHILAVPRFVNENDLYRHPDHGDLLAAVNACRNAVLTTARSNLSDRKGSRPFSRDTACSKSERS